MVTSSSDLQGWGPESHHHTMLAHESHDVPVKGRRNLEWILQQRSDDSRGTPRPTTATGAIVCGTNLPLLSFSQEERSTGTPEGDTPRNVWKNEYEWNKGWSVVKAVTHHPDPPWGVKDLLPQMLSAQEAATSHIVSGEESCLTQGHSPSQGSLYPLTDHPRSQALSPQIRTALKGHLFCRAPHGWLRHPLRVHHSLAAASSHSCFLPSLPHFPGVIRLHSNIPFAY